MTEVGRTAGGGRQISRVQWEWIEWTTNIDPLYRAPFAKYLNVLIISEFGDIRRLASKFLQPKQIPWRNKG
ncbi:hypothetical protein KFK09_010699 [Dendrobium nobile]|uniref:Uncharacterized protein n=1 Tax=Dendrobium nobile TaxID=94219 RepID=A0A8T3BAQ0_DENNO|nr:hypothetical protein KFK09_010699 [Dendrobium nobile]